MSVPTCSSTFFPQPESARRLLYVGCDSGLVVALRDILSEPEYRVVTCPDRGTAGLFLASKIPYQVLLLDLEWRGTKGLKVARLAHSLRHRKKMSTILVAATKLSRHMESVARKAGIAEWVMKTEDMAKVTEAIKRWLGSEGRESKSKS